MGKGTSIHTALRSTPTPTERLRTAGAWPLPGERARCCPWRACQTRGVDTRSLSPGGPGVGGEVGRLPVITPGTQLRRASAAGPGRAFGGRRSMVTARDRPRAGLESPAECHGTEGTLCSHSHLECPPVSRAALAERARGGAVAEEGPPRPGPRCGSSPQFRGHRGIAAGRLWFPSCTLEGQGTVLHPQLPLWGPPVTDPPSLPQV